MFRVLSEWIDEEAPPLDLSMPQVYRRPMAPSFIPKRAAHTQKLLREVREAHRLQDRAGFGRLYGELTAQFQPVLQWAISCWEFLLSTEGCRFVPRSFDEKMFARGDYRVFTENDFQSLAYRSFKQSLWNYLEAGATSHFAWHLKRTLWPTAVENYRALENPPDSHQRKLTAYSYLRCIPYQFLNRYHHERVLKTVRKLPSLQKEVIDLYYLKFYNEETLRGKLQISFQAFRRRQKGALRTIAAQDYLSFILLNQIERY